MIKRFKLLRLLIYGNDMFSFLEPRLDILRYAIENNDKTAPKQLAYLEDKVIEVSEAFTVNLN